MKKIFDTDSGLSNIAHLIGKVQAGFKVMPAPTKKIVGHPSRNLMSQFAISSFRIPLWSIET